MDDTKALFACYDWAIIRLVTRRRPGEKNRAPLLAFASLEFVHSGRPQPDSSPLNGDIPPYEYGKASGLNVYFRRIGMNATDALSWYRQAASGKLSVPIPADPEEQGKFDGSPLRGPTL